MKLSFTFLLTFSALFANAQMQFVAPKPGATMQNPERSIVIRPGNPLDAASLSPSLFSIKGSLSGAHSFRLKLALDKKTLNLIPVKPFAYGETVTVNIQPGIRETDGDIYKGYAFSFSIQRQYTPEEKQQIADARLSVMREDGYYAPLIKTSEQAETPGDYTILVNTNPTVGQVFLSNNRSHVNQKMWIIQNNGDSVFARASNSTGSGWTLNHNGYLTAFNDSDNNSFIMYDSNYAPIAVYKTSNGYPTDLHEFQIFPDGHYFLIGLDTRIVDMTVYNQNYQPDCKVTGNIIQEFDADTNLLFEWDTWDYIDITEAIHENFANSQFDAVHMNSIEVDTDGNIIVSCRHLDQIDKIDLSTGDFIWRWGGVENEFTFTNDPAEFNYQHDARRLSNGHITLFDNNNFGTPNTCYAKEYQLDEVKKKATLVWSYTHPLINGKAMTSSATGSVQRFDNGHTLIDWGFVPTTGEFPNIDEIDSNDNIVWELQYEGSDGIYRSSRHSWAPCSRPSTGSLYATDITATTATLNWNAATGAVKYDIQYRKRGTNRWKHVRVKAPALSCTITDLVPGKNVDWQISSWCDKKGYTKSALTPIQSFKTLTATAKEEILTTDVIPSMKIYPNPASDFVTVHWVQNNSKVNEAHVEIINMLGQTILTRKLSSNEGENESTLDVGSLTNGLYLIRLTNGDQQFETKCLKE